MNFCTLRVPFYEKRMPKILIVSAVKLIDFKPQTASKTPFREPSPAISHLMKFAFSPQKRETTLNVSIRFVTDNKSLRKRVNHPRKQYTKKHD